MEWIDVCDVAAECAGRNGQPGESCPADPVFRGALFSDDRPEPEEAEKVAGDAGAVEVRRQGDDQWRPSRNGVDGEGRCCGAAGPAGWREAGVRQERDCRGDDRRAGGLKRRMQIAGCVESRTCRLNLPLITDEEEAGFAAGMKHRGCTLE